MPVWVVRAGRVALPAALVVASQMIAFPMPLGVMLQGVIVGLLGAMVAVGMGEDIDLLPDATFHGNRVGEVPLLSDREERAVRRANPWSDCAMVEAPVAVTTWTGGMG